MTNKQKQMLTDAVKKSKICYFCGESFIFSLSNYKYNLDAAICSDCDRQLIKLNCMKCVKYKKKNHKDTVNDDATLDVFLKDCTKCIIKNKKKFKKMLKIDNLP